MSKPFTLLGALGLLLLAGCTVKNTEAPALSGPSTFAMAISMTTSADSLRQDGASQATIEVLVRDSNGRPMAANLRAEMFVNGAAQDFGTLSDKTFSTDATTGRRVIIYTAPPAPTESSGTGTVVTITVVPIGGDYRAEIRRQVDIRLVPPGVILPPNGAPVASFVVSPTPVTRGATTTFDASATSDEGVACGSKCTYSWNFGDGTTGAGVVTTHQYRSSGTFTAALTVTDDRATSHTVTQVVAVGAATPPTASFTVSPSAPGVGQTVFFNASASKPAANRSIISYDWDFGQGSTGSGVTVSKAYELPGSYVVTLKVTDDVAEFATSTTTVTVGGVASSPTARLDVSPVAATTATDINFDASRSTPASSPIAKYGFNWGDGTTSNLIAPDSRTSHRYAAAGTYVVRLTVEDAQGRTGSLTVNVTVS